MQSSDSTDKTTDASKKPSSPESSDDDSKTESKWTPLPPPNMEAILAKMPLIPLTLEQLCAPTSEDEEEEQVKEIGQNKQSNPTTTSTTHSTLVQNNLEKDVSSGLRDNTMPVSSSDTMTSSSNTSTVNTISHSINDTQQQSGNYSKKSQIKSTKMSTKPPNPKVMHIDLTDQEKPCTSNSDHPTASRSKNSLSQRDEQLLLAKSNKKDLPMPTHLTDSSDLETNFDILCKNIDLDITKEEKPCTSSSGWKSNSSSSNKMENQTTYNINLTDYSEIEDDFDHLCKDIDFDTIDDFSDTETESKSHSSCSTGKGKGKASCNGQRNIQKSVADSSSSINVTPQEPEFIGRGKSATFQSNVTSSTSKTSSFGERTSSQVTQKNNTVSSSQPTSTIHPSTTSKYAGSKRPNELDHVLSRSKKPRLEISRQQPHYSKHVTTSTSKKSSNLSNTGGMNHIVSHRHNITLPITHQSCDTISEPAATLKQSSLSSLSQQTSNHGITILQQNTSHKSTQQSTTIHNSIPQQVKAQAMPHTAHDHSSTNTARAMPRTTQAMPVVTPRAALHNVNTPTNSRTTPLGSQLTADKCPMCNTKFPSWYVSFSLVLDVECMYTCHRYEQVDADQHIARCLQAVMDLEIENDLVLL